MRYVDGFLLAVPKKNLKAYKTMSTKAGKVWMEHGALQYVETVGDDLKITMCGSFLDVVKLKKGETVVFSFIVYKSRAHRDSVNKKVMTDPRLAKMMKMKKMPFDPSRMSYGGFTTLVDM